MGHKAHLFDPRTGAALSRNDTKEEGMLKNERRQETHIPLRPVRTNDPRRGGVQSRTTAGGPVELSRPPVRHLGEADVSLGPGDMCKKTGSVREPWELGRLPGVNLIYFFHLHFLFPLVGCSHDNKNVGDLRWN